MTDPADPAGPSAAELASALRRWLRRRREPPQVQAAALMYEVAALIAWHADTVADAEALIDAWTVSMKAQVQRLGVGVDHP